MEKMIKNKEVKSNNMGIGPESSMPMESQQPMMPQKPLMQQQPMMPQQPLMQQQPMMPQQPSMQQQPMMSQQPLMQQPMMPQPEMPMMQMPNQMPMMQMPNQMPMMQMPNQMPYMGDMQGLDCMPPPVCPYLANMQCPMMMNQGFGGMNSMPPMGQMYQPPIYMMYPYMNPNR